MTVYGSTQIYLMTVEADKLIEVQAACRVWERRGFTVLSVAPIAEDTGQRTIVRRWVVTMRASSTLYVNWLMHDKLYQSGEYDGQAEAEAAERSIIMKYGMDVVKDIYVTAQRDHDREWMGVE